MPLNEKICQDECSKTLNSANDVERYHNLNFQVFGSVSPGLSNFTSSRASGKKYKLYDDASSNYCIRTLKKPKVIDLSYIPNSCNRLFPLDKCSYSSSSQHSRDLLVRDEPVTNRKTVVKNEITPTTFNEWEIDENSSGCEASSCKNDSVMKLDPTFGNNLASPIAASSTVSTPASIRGSSRTSLPCKKFKKRLTSTKQNLGSISSASTSGTNQKYVEKEDYWDMPCTHSYTVGKPHITITTDCSPEKCDNITIIDVSPDKKGPGFRSNSPLNIIRKNTCSDKSKMSNRLELNSSVTLKNPTENESIKWSDSEDERSDTFASGSEHVRIHLNNSIRHELTPIKSEREINVIIHDETPEKKDGFSDTSIKYSLRSAVNSDAFILKCNNYLTDVCRQKYSEAIRITNNSPYKLEETASSISSAIKKSWTRKVKVQKNGRVSCDNLPVNNEIKSFYMCTASTYYRNGAVNVQSKGSRCSDPKPDQNVSCEVVENKTSVKSPAFCKTNLPIKNSLGLSEIIRKSHQTGEMEKQTSHCDSQEMFTGECGNSESVLIDFDKTPQNSQEVFDNCRTPIKNHMFDICEVLTPKQYQDAHHYSSPHKSKICLIIKSDKNNKFIFPDSSDEVNSKGPDEFDGDAKCKVSEAVADIECDDDICLDEAGRPTLQYDIDTFPSPRRDESATPFQRTHAEISSLTQKKDSELAENSKEVLFVYKKKRHLIKAGTLLAKAVAAVDTLKSNRKLLCYELQVGLRTMENSCKSDLLKIIKMWNDHSSFYIRCRLHRSEYKNFKYVIFILRQKPKDISSNNLIRIYYPVKMFKSNYADCTICIPHYIEIVKDECRLNNFIMSDKPSADLQNRLLTEVFQTVAKCGQFYSKLEDSNSQSVNDALLNSSLKLSVSIRSTILHTVATDSNLRFCAVDQLGGFLSFQCDSPYAGTKANFDLSESVLNNIIFEGETNLFEDVKLRSLFEFCYCEVIKEDSVVHNVVPGDAWTINDIVVLNKIETSTKKKIEIENVDLNIIKRYKLVLHIIDIRNDDLIVKSIDSLYQFKILMDNNCSLVGALKLNINVMFDGIICYKNQFVVDKYTSVTIL